MRQSPAAQALVACLGWLLASPPSAALARIPDTGVSGPASPWPSGMPAPAPPTDTLELPAHSVRVARPEPAWRTPAEGLRFSREELIRAPSALGDPSRFVQTLPGAGRPNDWETTLSVRGGSPDQSVFILDGVPLSRVSHFEGMRSDHGGSGLVNLAYAEELVFHRGPLPARMPDRLSGAVEMRFRDGNAHRPAGRMAADVTGVGGAAEGPLGAAGGGSYATAFRYSALDLLVRSGVVEAYGAPQYWNGQLRLRVPAGNSAFRLHVLGGMEDWRNDIGGAAVLDLQGHTYSTALDWERKWRKAWTRASLHVQEHRQIADFGTQGARREPADSLTHRETGRDRRYGASLEQSFALGRDLEIRFGASEDLVVRRRRFEYGDQATYLRDRDTVLERTRALRMQSRAWSEAAAYGEASLRTGDWEWYAGYRHFYEEISDQHGFGPRLSVRHRPSERHAFRAAFGLHTQPHEYADYRRLAGPPRLPYSAQAALSWEWKTASGLLLSLEGYAKEGFRLSRPRMVLDGDGVSEVYLDTGRTSDRGLDLLLHRPRGGPFSFTLAYGLLHHMEVDASGDWGPGPYSVPQSLSAAAEVVLAPGLYLGCRYSMASGYPYTPMDTAASFLHGTGVHDFSRAWRETGERIERLDVRLEAVRRLGGMEVTLYGEVENVLDRRNDFGMRWSPLEGRAMPVEGMGRLPMAGISVAI